MVASWHRDGPWTTAVENRSDRALRFDLGLEWALMLLGGGGNPAAYYEIGGQKQAHDGAGHTKAAVTPR